MLREDNGASWNLEARLSFIDSDDLETVDYRDSNPKNN